MDWFYKLAIYSVIHITLHVNEIDENEFDQQFLYFHETKIIRAREGAMF